MPFVSAVKPLQIANAASCGWYPIAHGDLAIAYQHVDGPRVISSISVVEDARDPEQQGPHYQGSISFYPTTASRPRRISSSDAAYILRTWFSLDGWEEDNHVYNGAARNFWRPVNENKVGLECFCKQHEPKIVEDKGDYVWRPVAE